MGAPTQKAQLPLSTWRERGAADSLARELLYLAAVAAVVFIAAWAGIELIREGGRIASLWLSNALALALLLRRSRDARGALLATVFAANAVANLYTGDALLLGLGLAACNVIEVAVAVALLHWARNQFLAMGESGGMARLLLYAGLIAPACSAVCAALLLSAATGADFAQVGLRWFAADSIGMIALAPMLVTLRRGTLRELFQASSPFGLLVLTALVLSVTTLVFMQQGYPILFLILPMLTLTAFRMRFVGTAILVALVSTIATVCTIRGLGPIAGAIPEITNRILFLQLFVVTLALTKLPVAVVLHERSLMQRDLVIATHDAKQAATAKSLFLATMSHEIRTPLTGVLGMIELLRSNPGERDRNRFLASLQQSANLLMTVLDDILDFSKLDNGDIRFEDIPFDLRQLARATVDLYHGAAQAKGLSLELFYTTNATAVCGDPVRLQQIMGNLISNAIKFTDIGRIEVRIETQASENGTVTATFSVIDTGIGIAPDQLGRLFSPFVQADASTNRRFGGTGLGLAICLRLVEALGGKLEVESIHGLGSTFRFKVGLKRGQLSATLPVTAPALAPTRSLQVLLAEDNPVNRLLVSTLVRRMGHEVETVENGWLAVEAVAARRYDVVLMDMQMPEMDGVAATRAIRATASGANLPIIALTADASPDRRRFYDNVGLTSFMTKPVDSKLLQERLAAIAETLPADDTGGEAVFDVARLDELGEAIGKGKVEELLAMLLSDLTVRAAKIVALANAAVTARLREELHALRGAAASVGALRLTAAIQAMEDAGSPADAAAAAPAFARAAEATSTEIAARQISGRRKLG